MHLVTGFVLNLTKEEITTDFHSPDLVNVHYVTVFGRFCPVALKSFYCMCKHMCRIDAIWTSKCNTGEAAVEKALRHCSEMTRMKYSQRQSCQNIQSDDELRARRKTTRNNSTNAPHVF